VVFCCLFVQCDSVILYVRLLQGAVVELKLRGGGRWTSQQTEQSRAEVGSRQQAGTGTSRKAEQQRKACCVQDSSRHTTWVTCLQLLHSCCLTNACHAAVYQHKGHPKTDSERTTSTNNQSTTTPNQPAGAVSRLRPALSARRPSVPTRAPTPKVSTQLHTHTATRKT
jgi:hypothetical protein